MVWVGEVGVRGSGGGDSTRRVSVGPTVSNGGVLLTSHNNKCAGFCEPPVSPSSNEKYTIRTVSVTTATPSAIDGSDGAGEGVGNGSRVGEGERATADPEARANLEERLSAPVSFCDEGGSLRPANEGPTAFFGR